MVANRQAACTEAEIRDAVTDVRSLADALRRLGLRPVGGNYKTLRRYLERYQIATDHLHPNWTLRSDFRHEAKPLAEILVEHSSYNRGKLKSRLYDEGVKQRRCELCGQDELWRGMPMPLIIDHINGVGDDNRLENLQIVCPNCASTLDTHCGRKNRILYELRACLHCDTEFRPKYPTHRYCSQACGSRACPGYVAYPERRKVQRPPHERLMAELGSSNWSAVARRYGVSDNAVRKWVRWYEADAQRRGEGDELGTA